MKKILFLLLVLSVSYTFAQSSLRTRAEDESAPELENLSGAQPGDIHNAEQFNTGNSTVVLNEGTEAYENTDATVTGSAKNLVTDTQKGLKDIVSDVYPNPASDFIVVTLSENRVVVLSIMNLVGQIVQTNTIEARENYINISALKEGIYFVSFQSGDEKITQKLKVVE